MRRIFQYTIGLVLIFTLCNSWAQIPPMGSAKNYFHEPRIKKSVDSLLRLMTVEEKIGQLVLFAGKGTVTGPSESKDIETYIAQGQCGGVFNIKELNESIRLQKLAVENSRLAIPMLFGFDVIHGFKTIFPVNIGLSSTWDIPATENLARISAVEASAVGVNWTFSPMCDISHDPRWGRVSEGSGEDPYLASAISAAMVRGYQGTDLSKNNTILSCVKHFAAYGAAQAGRDYHTVDMSERMFRDVYLPPYRAAIDAGAATVMTSFNDFDGVPASASQFLMKDLLRKELSFNGFVVTDYTAIMELIPHGVAKDGKDAALQGLEADVNMDMVSNLYLLHTKELIDEGKIDLQLLDRLCGEVLGMKFRLGLFADPYRYCIKGRDQQMFYKAEHLDAARSVARSSMVLLKNEAKVLPLKKGANIALVGPFGDAPREMLGSWVIGGDPKKTSSFLSGLKEHFGADKVSFTPACKANEAIDGGLGKARELAAQSDVILLALGLPQAWSGEAASLTSIELPQAQKELLKEMKKTGKPVVILLVTARPLDLTEETELADAILVTWHPGTMAGEALADVISGSYTPSGKLTMTFPRSIGQIPIHYNMKNTGRPVGYASMSSAKYTSRYLFTPNEPLYCFGYGLSYTEFEYSNLKVLTPKAKIGQPVKVSVTVANMGQYDAEEVVQLYIRDLVSRVTRPVKELKGFQKVMLKAGETKNLEFTLTPDDLSFYRYDRVTGQEAGDYHLWIGTNSDAALKGSFTIEQ